MKNVKVSENLSMPEIVKILSILAEIDTIIDIEKNEGAGQHGISARWLSEEHVEESQELVKSAFRGVHNYLVHIADRDPAKLKEYQVAKSIYSLMMFVMEAADKIEKSTPLFKVNPSLDTIADLPEYRELQEFYLSAVALKLPPPSEFEDRWELEWGIKNQDLTDIKSFGLRTAREVCMDGQYELLYILSENGRPFYDYDVIRHMRMLYDFERATKRLDLDNLFQKIDIVTDRECHARAMIMIKNCYYLIDDFFKEAFKYKESVCVSNMCSAVMGLMLAANARNLRQTSTSEKTAYGYFLDFQVYLRKAINSDEYQKLINLSNDRRPFQANLYLLVHKLVLSYFTNFIDHKEMSAILRRLVSEGSIEMEKNEALSSRHFSYYLREDQALRRSLDKYPAGAIHKLAEVFINRQNNKGFDPIAQKNIPEKLYHFYSNEKEITCLHFPTPVKQEFIQKAEIVIEYDVFLRSLTLGSTDRRILVVNLQSRTSWQDFARCICLEDMLRVESNARKVSMLGLPKNTSFYLQSEGYLDQDDATIFIQQFTEQIISREQCGYYFSNDLYQVIESKLAHVFSMVHKLFFDNKFTLGQFDRRDFIEIAYVFITLISLESSKADYISFIDKCSVDAGPISSAEWFGFIKLISKSGMTEEDKSYFYYIMHAHALILRERVADEELSKRALFALVRMENAIAENNDLFTQMCSELGFSCIKM